MMLLDTHALVWLVEGLPELGKVARKRIDQALSDDALGVSSISFWEIALLQQKQRIGISQPILAWRHHLFEVGIQEIPMNGEIGIAATTLEHFHADPADRFITATALLLSASFLTADQRILRWAGPVKRIDASR